MKIVYFTHSLQSCWNHGNAHFLRGVLRELVSRGHAATAWEPAEGWSVENLLRDEGREGLLPFARAYPELSASVYGAAFDIERAVADADLVIVHEWTDPETIAAVGRARRHGRFTLLFHDTHHRAVSDPEAMRALALEDYDGVLAFGRPIAEIYRGWGWGDRVFVWHEAADVRLFRPPAEPVRRDGLVWIGNWGDGERSAELESYLLEPAARAGLTLDIHGVRYPPEAREALARHGARYHGWIANPDVPGIFARHLATVHVPRRFYVEALPGIPTIRMFEALACGIPLASAPWRDEEGLFTAGTDYLLARDPAEMLEHLRALRDDAGLRRTLSESGVATVRARHTCAHRVDELLAILDRLAPQIALKAAS
jgi:spore maturation protein CgeB